MMTKKVKKLATLWQICSGEREKRVNEEVTILKQVQPPYDSDDEDDEEQQQQQQAHDITDDGQQQETAMDQDIDDTAAGEGGLSAAELERRRRLEYEEGDDDEATVVEQKVQYAQIKLAKLPMASEAHKVCRQTVYSREEVADNITPIAMACKGTSTLSGRGEPV